MIPAETNHKVACLTTEELLFGVPDVLGIKSFCRRITVCLLEDLTRDAMLYVLKPFTSHKSKPFVIGIPLNPKFCTSLPTQHSTQLLLPKSTYAFQGEVLTTSST